MTSQRAPVFFDLSPFFLRLALDRQRRRVLHLDPVRGLAWAMKTAPPAVMSPPVIRISNHAGIGAIEIDIAI